MNFKKVNDLDFIEYFYDQLRAADESCKLQGFH